MKVVVSGYYGFGNLGDEAVLAATVQGLRRHAPGCRLVVLSARPRRTAYEHGVGAVPRLHPWAVLSALRGARLLLSGGGSLLQDVTGPFSLPYYLSVVELALALGVPVMVFAQGVGPLRRSLSRRWVRRVLARARHVTVRDPDSLELLRRLGVTDVPVEVTADPVLSLDVSAWLPPAPPERPYLAVNVRARGLDEEGARRLGRALGGLAAAEGLELRFVPMEPVEDGHAARTVAAAAAEAGAAGVQVVPGPLSLAGAVSLLAGAEAVVAMRLHALVLAAMAGRPLLGLSYDPKVDAFLARLGLQPLAPTRALPAAGDLEERLRAAYAARHAAAKAAAARLPDLRAAAERNFERVAQLLAGEAGDRRAATPGGRPSPS